MKRIVTFSMLLLFFLSPFLSAEEPQGVPPLKIVYFTPSDRTPPPDRQERLGRVMKNIQDFYRKGMEANGYGQKTFALEWDSPEKLRLYDVQGQRKFEDYPKGSEPIVGEEVQNALKLQGINIDNEYVLILGAWVEWKDGVAREIGPYSGGGSMFSGFAFACDDKFIDADLLASKEPGGFHYMVGPCSLGMYNTLYIGGIAHELGHAFGLPHDCERDAQREKLGISLMGVGNHYYGKASRGEGHDAFLSPASALLLSEGRAFNPHFTQTDGQFDIDQLDADVQDGKLIVNIKVRSESPMAGVIAYNDNLSISGDYDAKTWIAVSKNPGEYRLEIDELDRVPYEMRLVFVFPNSKSEVLIPYSNISGTPTVQAFYDTFVRTACNTLLDQKAWDTVAEVLDKQITKFPKSLSWTQKRKHLEMVKNPPAAFDLDNVPEEEKTVDLTYAKALEATVGWYEPSRGILRECGFFEVDGTFFDSGIYAHPPSRYVFSLGKKWTEFRFKYGIQDGKPGSVVFVVRGDGKELFRSETVRAGDIRFKKIDVSDVEKLELRTEDARDGWANDWGLWLDPRLER
ncbi:MAG: NPCBM/NEW2 domain-containing protein [Planctomycetaceae bacterium]|jgi:hypothetical protein|nr:NPCBM/NEW2 domain-containing protein [Planctomycetaceae bacterium]